MEASKSISISHIEHLNDRVHELRSHARDLADNLKSILDILGMDEFIAEDMFQSSVDKINDHRFMQTDLIEELGSLFPSSQVNSTDDVEKVLAAARQQLEICDSALSALKLFQHVDIDHAETKKLLVECQNKAAALAGSADPSSLDKHALPYKLFLEIMKMEEADKDIITIEQSSIIEEVFPRPMPMMLYRGRFFHGDSAQKESPQQEKKVEEKPPIPRVPSEEGVKASNIPTATEPSQKREPITNSVFTFKTNKQEKYFRVNSFRSDIKDSGCSSFLIEMLYVLGWCRVLSKEQIQRHFADKSDSPRLIEASLRPLVREGYLSEISKEGTGEIFYCLSTKGIQAFHKQESWEEFRKRIPTASGKLEKPRLLTGTSHYQERAYLVEEISRLNDVALRWYDAVIPNLENSISSSIYHREIPESRAPYVELVAAMKHGQNVRILVIGTVFLDAVDQSYQTAALENTDLALVMRRDTIWTDLHQAAKDRVPKHAICYGVMWLEEIQDIMYCDPHGNPVDFSEVAGIFRANGDSRSEEKSLEGHLIADRDSKEEIPSGLEAEVEPEPEAEQETASEPETALELEIAIKSEDAVARVDEALVSPRTEQTNVASDEEAFEEVNEEVRGWHEELLSTPDIEKSSSKQLAAYLLEKNVKTVKIEEALPIIEKLASEGLVVEATVFAKALSFIPDAQFAALYRRLLWAANLSLDSHKYTGERLGGLEEDDSQLLDKLPAEFLALMKLSCFAWAFFVPDIPRDYMLYSYKDSVYTTIDQHFAESLPSLKQVFSVLFEMDDYAPSGFTSAIMSLFKSEAEKRKGQSLVRQKAKNLLAEPQIRARIHGAPEFLAACFGIKSEFYMCMKAISGADKNAASAITQLLSQFSEADGSHGVSEWNYSEDRVEEYIDLLWNNINTTKFDKLRYGPRKTVFMQIKNRLDVMLEWLLLNNDSAGVSSAKVLDQLSRIRNQLVARLTDSLAEIKTVKQEGTLGLQAGLAVLTRTFERMTRYLKEGAAFYQKWDYISMLSSYRVNLDDELKPNLNARMQSVAGCEPWKKVMQHVADDKLIPEEALKQIDEPGSPNWYNNYATAEHLCEYLNETKNMSKVDYADSMIAAKHEAIKYEDAFRSRFELAYAYGSIEENTKESILQTVSIFKSYFEDSGDYAHYRAFLDELGKRIEYESAQREAELVERKERSVADRGLAPEDAPILAVIERNIQEKNYAVAEEYLNMLEAGETQLPMEELRLDEEVDFHSSFVEAYPEFYSTCLKDRNRMDTPYNWGYASIERKLSPTWLSGQKKSTEDFIKTWPRGQNSDVANSVRSFLSSFDFRVEALSPKAVPQANCKLFVASICPKEKNKQDYPHPISRFGTLISNPVHIVCIFGANTANELINTMTNRLQLGNNTIVLLDGALSLDERRKVAEKFKSDTSGQKFFLLVDRVLLLFLATLDRAERLPALLKCTLPYTYYQPYVHGGGRVDDEMFFGRKTELNSILNPNGACFVYGGRQLGKTALLQRASSIAHNPGEKRFALYINIIEKKSEDLLKELCDELRSERFKLTRNSHSSFESLCKDLAESFDRGTVNQLQLFIDETDTFLDEISKDMYSALTPFVNLRNRTNSRFKFVMAGLHNVARSKSAMDRNSIFQQLGAPLCVMPLSPTDARKLVEKPLSFLGFKMDTPKQLSLILANTNYYPGILHFLCYTLVEEVAANYRNYFSAASGNPPYVLKDDHLKRVFVSGNINSEIKAKLESTLKLDIRYKVIANILTYLYYEDEKHGINNLKGYDVSYIKNAFPLPIDCVHRLSDEDMELLLMEMVNMGILWSKPGSHLFRLRKNNFLDMIGSHDRVEEFLISVSEG